MNAEKYAIDAYINREKENQSNIEENRIAQKIKQAIAEILGKDVAVRLFTEYGSTWALIDGLEYLRFTYDGINLRCSNQSGGWLDDGTFMGSPYVKSWADLGKIIVRIKGATTRAASARALEFPLDKLYLITRPYDIIGSHTDPESGQTFIVVEF